jgi:hypothetical protein
VRSCTRSSRPRAIPVRHDHQGHLGARAADYFRDRRLTARVRQLCAEAVGNPCRRLAGGRQSTRSASGHRRSVNPSAYAYAGSNPAPATQRKGPLTWAFAHRRPFVVPPRGMCGDRYPTLRPGCSTKPLTCGNAVTLSVNVWSVGNTWGSSWRRAPGRSRKTASDLHVRLGRGYATATE